MKKLLALFVTLLSLCAYAQDNKYQPSSKGEIVKHQHYILSYAEDHEQAEWVAYELTAHETVKLVERADKFRPDPSVSSGSARLADYKASGYDRGHLAPAADMGFSATAMSESFYMSNMSPQKPSFNRGIWKQLESLVRSYAKSYGKIYVVTGPVLNTSAQQIGNGVTVPNRYYKIIMRGEGENRKMIAFLLSNAKHDQDISKFVVNTDIIESISGIDFFPQLPDNLEDKLEYNVDKENWYFDPSINTNKTRKNESVTTASIQCCGTTKSGSKCKRKAAAGSKYCWQHQQK
ncbi:DNA/RNA non-specific endonuclease [Marinifilum caeruleilacunae]|uniref:Endonuclease n=1 Tax=Marinifilum caeruleilacunae TaxID=2499076 RepID=A0ABX1WUC7_9BACT|nr:DNA/RNA non-specific endonuclease [Marinifilum caeruleilacunae]NOU59672.1 DNA/RNA non-specific endonuclease [Marinifilum caeruleilacunae]